MAADETDNLTKPARPSWETAAPAARPPAPRPAAPQPAAPAYSPPPAAYTPSPAAYTPSPAAYTPSPAPSHFSEPLSDPNVRYDLAGNPIVTSTPPPIAPPAPYGYSAGPLPAAPGTWPPPPSTPYGGAWQGGGNGTDQVARLKWNWGAFLIPFWWSVFNGQKGIAWVIFFTNIGDRYVPAPFGYIFSVVQFGIMVYLGVMGHRLAWSSERFAGDYDNFIRTQRAWMIWGFAITALIVIAMVAAFAVFPGVIGSMLGTHHPSSHYGSGSYGAGSDGSDSSSGSGSSSSSGQ